MMKYNYKILKTITGLLCLGVLTIGVVILVDKFRPLPQPEFINKRSSNIAMTAELVVLFPQEMDQKSVEDRLTSQPPLDFTYRWEGKRLILTPVTVLPSGEVVTIVLSAGSSSSGKRQYLTDYEWAFQVRPARILYLGNATTSPEVWIWNPDARAASPLTRTGGAVTGFSPFPDGSAVLYTKKNDQGGSDIYQVMDDAEDNQILLNCGKDTCRDAVISKDGKKIAFSRNQSPVTSEPSKGFYIYTMDMNTRTVSPLYPEGIFRGSSPNWSPDGKILAFYDHSSLGIRIRNSEGDNDFLLGTTREQTGAWSADSASFLFVDDIPFTDNDTEEGFLYSKLYELDLKTSSISEPIGSEYGHEEYGFPAWSPDGKSLAMGVRQVNAEVTKQLWLFDLDKKTRKAITTESAYTNAATQWRPDGNALVFQQAQPGASGMKPNIILWNKENNTLETIASDGALPAWLP